MTSSPKESPVGSKSQLKFLSEPCWMFETITWLLVWVTGLQSTCLKGTKAWGSLHLAVQVAAHQTKEHHWVFFWIRSLPRKVWWNCKSTHHWLASANFVIFLPGQHLDYQAGVVSNWSRSSATLMHSIHWLSFLLVFLLPVKAGVQKIRDEEGRKWYAVAAHLIPPYGIIPASTCTQAQELTAPAVWMNH